MSCSNRFRGRHCVRDHLAVSAREDALLASRRFRRIPLQIASRISPGSSIGSGKASDHPSLTSQNITGSSR